LKAGASISVGLVPTAWLQGNLIASLAYFICETENVMKLLYIGAIN